MEWQQRQTQGEFTPLGQDDYLNRALGRNAEHPGRTRGVGSKVGFTRVFGTSTPRSKYNTDDPTFQAAVQEEVKKVIPNLEARWASKFDEQKQEFEQRWAMMEARWTSMAQQAPPAPAPTQSSPAVGSSHDPMDPLAGMEV